MKPKLYRTSCKVFRSTHPLIVSPTCPREALFVFPPSRPSNISSFTVELILSSPCSRSDPPSPAKVRLSLTLILFHLTTWRDGFVPFPFGKGGSGVLANCSLCGTEATLSFSAGPVYLDFSTESGLGSTSKFAIFPLLFSDSLSLFSTHCPLLHLSFYLNLSGTSGRNCLLSPPLPLGYDGSLDTPFFRGTTQLVSWLGGVHYFYPLQFLVVSLLLPLLSTPVFTRVGGELSHSNSLTHRFIQCPLRNLCSLVTLAGPLSFSLQWTQFSVKLLSH